MTQNPEAPTLRTYAGGQQYYWNLESLRFFCAILVTLVHIAWPTSLKALPVIPQAWLFVDFFFVLSGFVIAMNYRGRIRDGAAARRFLIRRFFRLYPLHVVTLLAMAALVAARNLVGTPGSEIGPATVTADWWWLVPLNLALLHAMGFTGHQILNAPSWSISTEWFAYCAFAIIALVWGRRHHPWLVWLVLGVGCLGLLSWQNGPRGVEGVFEHSFVRCIASFSLGILVQMVVVRVPNAVPVSLAGWLQIVAILIALTMVTLTGRNPWIGYTLPPIFALIITLMALDRGSIVRRALEVRPLEHLGKRSYSIYMVHTPIVTSIDFLLRQAHEGGSVVFGNIAVVIYLSLVIGVSELTYRFVEQPWRVFGRKLTN